MISGRDREALIESERSKSVLLSNLPGMAYRCKFDRQWTMEFVSAGCLELTGYAPEDLVDNRTLSYNDVIAPEYRDFLWKLWRENLEDKKSFRGEYEIVTASGQRKWVLETGQFILDGQGGVEALEGIIIDITRRKQFEQRLQRISEHDPLTGLPNRLYFEKFLSQAQQRGEGESAVVMVELTHLNALTLSYGYSFKEQIMMETASRLKRLASDDNQIFQVSPERIAFFMRGCTPEEPFLLCNSIASALSCMPMIHAAGCGLGIFSFRIPGKDQDDILKNASIAAVRGGRQGTFGVCAFNGEMEEKAERERLIKDEIIASALDEGLQSIYPEFQPIVDLKSGRIKGFEALARMKNPVLGMVPPAEFIPLAEELQLIGPLGRRVLAEACDFLLGLRKAGHFDIHCSVNVSALELVNDSYLGDFHSLVAEKGVPVRSLCLEITESFVAFNFDLVNRKLGELRRMGASASLDDFGTGQSSFFRARDLNVDYLKIAKPFADKIMDTPQNRLVTGDIISMAHRLGYRVIAEGVEHEVQRQYLAGKGCDFCQGYLFSRPLSARKALELADMMNRF